MESTRQEKIARLIQKELALIFQLEGLKLFPGKMITVTKINVTPDLSICRVNLSIYCPNEEINSVEFVKEHAGYIKGILGRKIKNQVHSIPHLIYHIDDSLDYIENIDKLLKS